jgi:hypothetical protein
MKIIFFIRRSLSLERFIRRGFGAGGIVLLFTLTAAYTFADVVPKTYMTARLSGSIKIDGLLNDEGWKNIPVADNFIMLDPQEGNPVTQRTEVRIAYDNTAVYVSAMMYDTAPDSILHELGLRDEGENLNADRFRFAIDTYNNRQDGYVFDVSVSNVQSDLRDSDPTFDAVWESATHRGPDGWSAEMRIPYSAIRFPKKEIQQWALQCARVIRRNREYDQWTLTPKAAQNRILYWGTMNGISDIESPLRLSLTPYLTLYGEQSPAIDAGNKTVYEKSTSYSFGADLKYGIDDRFTLDMTLLPDFSQVQSDNKVKNLTAFETVYDEKRPFFKEGVELFAKGNLFYSRRIGRTPGLFYDVPYLLNAGEVIDENPDKVRLLNGVKVSGRTDKGLGVGLLNAVTAEMNAVVKDPEGNKREIETEPLTNYNIIVLDQNLPHNSDVFLVNTNVMRAGSARDANVTAAQGKYEMKNHLFRFTGFYSMSRTYNHVYDTENNLVKEDKVGNQYSFAIDKVKGAWNYGVSHESADKNYDKNDLGRNFYRDFVTDIAYAYFNANNPFWKVFKYGQGGFNFTRSQRLAKGDQTSIDINVWEFLLFNNNYSLNTTIGMNPVKGRDYYEPRTEGRFYQTPVINHYISLNASTNYNRTLAFDFGGRSSTANEINYFSYGYYIVPIIRFSDKWNMKLSVYWDKYENDRGWVNTLSPDEIIFGQRTIQTIENTLTSRYLFKNDMALSVTARHYWSKGQYSHFFLLNNDGTLTGNDAYAGDYDFNTNFFNVDVSYSWQFAPGSSFILTYKNEIYRDPYPVTRQEFGYHYDNDLRHTLDSPQTNSISLKVLYYLDYSYLKRKA